MSLLEHLNWRYATKRMTGEKVPEQKLNNILEAIRLSASSMGLQPYTLYVISNPETKKEIFEKAAKLPQIQEASHLIVFAAWDPITEEHIEDYIDLIVSERGLAPEALSDFRNKLLDLIQNRSRGENFEWAARQIFIGLGTGLTAAAIERVDGAQIEIFNTQKMDEVLKLQQKGLRSVVIMTVGYRDETKDYMVKARKVRRDKHKFMMKID